MQFQVKFQAENGEPRMAVADDSESMVGSHQHGSVDVWCHNYFNCFYWRQILGSWCRTGYVVRVQSITQFAVSYKSSQRGTVLEKTCETHSEIWWFLVSLDLKLGRTSFRTEFLRWPFYGVLYFHPADNKRSERSIIYLSISRCSIFSKRFRKGCEVFYGSLQANKT